MCTIPRFSIALAAIVLSTLGAANPLLGDVPCADYRLPIRSLGTIPTPGGARRVAMMPGWAFVLEGDKGLTVLDLTDLAHAAVANRLTLQANAVDLAIANGQLLVTLGSAGLAAYDLSSPASPSAMGTLSGLGGTSRIAADGLLICVTGDSLHVVATVPGAAPVRVGSLFHWAVLGEVVVAGSRAYTLANGISLIDLSDPANPRMAGYDPWGGVCEMYGATAAVARGTIVYSTRQWFNTCYGPQGGEVAVTDFSDPAAPHTGGRHNLFGSGGLAAAGALLYAAEDGPLLCVFDATEPLSPHLAGVMPLAHAASGIARAGEVACVVEGANVELVSVVEHAELPAPLASFAQPSSVQDAQLQGSLAYVIDWAQGLCVLDVTDPTAPAVAATIPVSGGARLAVSTDRLYVLTSQSGVCAIRVYALDSAGLPVPLGQTVIPGSPSAIAARGRYAWTAGGSGISVWDCRDGGAPVQARSWPARAGSLAIDGDRLYAAGYDTLRIFAFTDSTTISLLGSKGHCGALVAAADGYVCVTGTAYDLLPVDVSNPASPVYGTAVQLPYAWDYDLTVAGGVAIRANSQAGVDFIDIHDPDSPRWLGVADPGTGSKVAAANGEIVLLLGGSSNYVFPSPCLTLVPVLLSNLRAWREPDAVRVFWSVSGGGADDGAGPDFRLAGSDGASEWLVPWTRDAAGFSARDASPGALRGAEVTYRLSCRENGGGWAPLGETTAPEPALPTRCGLLAAYPNPFNPRLTVTLALGRPRDVKVTIHDLTGRVVVRLLDGPLAAGLHSLTWDGLRSGGLPAASGVYFVRMAWTGGSSTRRVVLAR